MYRPAVLITLALIAVACLAPAATASDSKLRSILRTHINSTVRLEKCASRNACTKEIIRNLSAVTAFTRRASVVVSGDPSGRCLATNLAYLPAFKKIIALAGRYVSSNGSRATRRAYLSQAVRLDTAMVLVWKAC